jgi:ligand-binding sensor domain-containing protein/signal transduction histidine kinase
MAKSPDSNAYRMCPSTSFPIRLLAASLWLLWMPAFALSPRIAVNQLGSDTWGTREGLPELAVQSLLEASDGYLWVGTQEGLARFDGVNFEVFNRANSSAFRSDFITALAEDNDKNLWIGTRDGVLVRTSDRKFRAISADDGNVISNVAAVVRDSEGTIWIGGAGGLESVSGQHFTRIGSGDGKVLTHVSQLVVDADGSVWGLADETPFRVRSGSIEKLGESAGIDGAKIRSMFPAQGGHPLLLAEKNVLLQSKGDQFEKWQIKGLSETAEILAAEDDREGNVWLSTRDEGLIRIRSGHLSDSIFDRGLSGIEIQTFLEDSRGNLWLGTLGKGLMCLRESTFAMLGKAQGLVAPLPVAVLDDADGVVWVGTYKGLTSFASEGSKTYTTANGLENNFVTSLARSALGGIWVGSSGNGLVRLFHGQPVETVRLDARKSIGRVAALLEDRRGRIWSGTREAGLALTAAGKTTFLTMRDGMPHNAVNVLLEAPDGSIWAGTETGIAQARVTDENGLAHIVSFPSNIQVESLCMDRDGVLWIGSRSDGLFTFKDGKYAPINVDPRLVRTTINGVIFDTYENLWLGTNHGVFRVSRDALRDPQDAQKSRGSVVRFGEDDGLVSSETIAGGQPAVWRDAKGNLWFVTTEGAVTVDPRSVSLINHELQTEIRTISVNGHEVTPVNGMLELSSGSSQLVIRFSAPDLSSGRSAIFRHRLGGADNDWVVSDGDREAVYPIIPAGLHKFEVEAGHENLEWPSRPTILTVSMRPPFYRTPQFAIAAIAILIVLAALFHHVRIKWISLRHAVSEERQKMAGEIHDGLAQGFSAISVQIQAALAQLKTDPAGAVGHLEVASEVSRLSLSDARESVWNLQSPLSSSDDLVAAIRAACEPIIYGTGVKLYVASEGTPRRLNPVVQNNLIRISQESVANAIRHGNASEVRISASFAFSELIFVIVDDGRGIEDKMSDAEEPHRGFGLKNIGHRVEDMHGTLELKTAIGVGTSITIRIPRFPFSRRSARPSNDTLRLKQ